MTTKQKVSHEKTKAWHTEHRRYNFLRIWCKRYYHMTARHNGNATHYSHSEGKGIMTKEEFFEWCKHPDQMAVFVGIYFDWMTADFPLGLSPSIDRIDSELGYVAGNIQWLTFDQNTEKNHKHVDPITKKMVYEPAEV